MNAPEESEPRRRMTGTVRLDISGIAPGGGADPERRPWLVAVAGGLRGRRFELHRGLEIGRAAGAGLRIAESAVSSRHCRLLVEGDEVHVEDLGSTNGSYVDGRPVEGRVRLLPGSLLRVGHSALRLDLLTADEVDELARLDEDLRRAAAYVRALFPEPRRDEGLSLDWAFKPCDAVGGDAFGYVDLSSDLIALYLIDVCGHGLQAALHSVSVINALRGRSLPQVDFSRPAEVLAALNRTFGMDEHGGQYFTIWYGVADLRDSTLRFASGGHPPALLRDDRGVSELGTKGCAIGLFETSRYDERELPFGPGSTLVIYSDGLIEQQTPSGEEWGAAAFRDFLAGADLRPGDSARELLDGIESLLGRDRWDDDVSLLIAQVPGCHPADEPEA